MFDLKFISFLKKDKEQKYFRQKIIEITGIKPKDESIYKNAFIHRSVVLKDTNGNPVNYERLEFLGDALLDAVITDYLYRNMPGSSEGELTKMRSKIVSRKNLNEVGKNMGLMRLAKKTNKTKNKGQRYSYNAHGDIFEALTAAIYLDRGYDVMHRFIQEKLIDKYVDLNTLTKRIQSYKSILVEWCQKNKKTYVYEITTEDTQEKKQYFNATLIIDGKPVTKARGVSKKKAEENAAKRAYYKLRIGKEIK